ncbi:MAG TPA: ribulokinase [Sphingobacterium sp.]|nr:ribulokinase [Sphingobacterium sp.]
MKHSNSLVIGIDYGTDSARAVLIDAETGKELALSAMEYPRWKRGLYCDPVRFQFRQHPLDYLEAIEHIIHEVLNRVPGSAQHIKAIGIDTTASTPVAVDYAGTPLAMRPEFTEYPNAMFVLWKDHTAQQACDHLNAFSKAWDIDYTRSALCGDYSTEHFWAKALHIFRDTRIRAAAHSFVELCDWLPGVLTGNTKPETLVRGIGIAASRGMWNKTWGGYPPNTYYKALDPALDGLIDTFGPEPYTLDRPAGTLAPEWAAKLGLSEKVIVAAGNVDCYAGAIGAGVRDKAMVEIIGTSTCAITVAPKTNHDGEVPGVPQQANDMIIPGMIGYEGGQSCYGDLYAWFKKILMWPLHNILANTTIVDHDTKTRLIDEVYTQMLPVLNSHAEVTLNEEGHIVSTDWINGRRSPNVDYDLKSTIAGLTLSSTAPLVYRSLVEATAFGAKAFIAQFQDNGGCLEEVIAVGGIASKSPYIMQVLADVIGMPINVIATPEACAHGAAITAAVVAGIYPDIPQAQEAMTMAASTVYKPNPDRHDHYAEHYKKYLKLEDVKNLIR